MTIIDGKSYWDGGLFDNTPLGAVLDRLDPATDVDRTIYVVNLFPNEAPIPTSMLEVTARTQNLQFANKTAEDLKQLVRIDEVVSLMQALESLPGGNPLANDPAYQTVANRRYVRVPRVVSITRPEQIAGLGASDFSPETIDKRAAEGYAQTDAALKA
jgi:predicted acylesterase/phospholipase RssA